MMSRRRSSVPVLAVAAGLVLAACAAAGPAAIQVAAADQPAASSAESGASDAIWAQVEYVLDGDLAPLAGSAMAYRAQGDGPAAADAQRLATALGLTDAVEPAPWGDAWVAGPTDGSGPSLTVNAGPLGDWWYGGSVQVACAEPALAPSPDGRETEIAQYRCGELQPASNLPSDDAAESAARGLMDSIGGWVGEDASVVRDDYGVTVQFAASLDGVRSDYTSTVRYVDDSLVESASGYLGTFAPAGEYPRIGTSAAFGLLQSGTGAPWLAAADSAVAEGSEDGAPPADVPSGGGSQPAAADSPTGAVAPGGAGTPGTGGSDTPAAEPDPDEPTAAPDDPGSPAEPTPRTDPAPGTTDPAPGTTDPAPGTTDPAPGTTAEPTFEPMPSPEPVTVRITGVEEGLWSLSATDGSVWLVPAYVFLAQDGAQHRVIAIPSDLIEVQQDTPVPADGDGGTGAGVPGSPGSAGSGSSGSGSAGSGSSGSAEPGRETVAPKPAE